MVMDKTTKDLKTFYNAQAESFSQTRKRHWPEFEHIISVIKKNKKKNISILELWCGDWRFARYLDEKLDKDMYYVWVDLSENLIKIATNETADAEFVVSEMWDYLNDIEQESLDFVVMVASFQHINTSKKRLEILKKIYKWLKYGWKVIMTNWSFSDWFVDKYKKVIIKALFKKVFTLWISKLNDLYIPWKDWELVFERYYHIFNLEEISQLLKVSGFVLNDCCYIDGSWEKTQGRKNSRNSFVVAEKEIFIK